MTLCIGWIRQKENTEELVFATDSTLTGGEKWNHGVKLFELPRKDCLICFAGETYRAYPLILNLITTIQHNPKLQDPNLDVQDVLYEIATIFSSLVNSIFNKPTGDTSQIGAEAKFLFGGWSWKESRFIIWKLFYSPDAKAFIYNEETTAENNLGKIAFLGDPEDDEKNIAQIAFERYKQELISANNFGGRLDMEPLKVLVAMSRDADIYEVDGAVQLGKVYKSGTSEFYGLMWPSVKGKPTFLGKQYAQHDKPDAKYFDPDSCELLLDGIPNKLQNIEAFAETEDYAFLKECYVQEDNFLKEVVSDKERDRLIAIFKQYSYDEFIKEAERNPAIEDQPKATIDEQS